MALVTQILGEENLDVAVELLEKGELVAVPTETVYGLCCDGLNENAVREIYEQKGRPEVKPLSLMINSFSEAEKYCDNIPKSAYFLAEKYLPGPLTIVLKSKPIVPEIVRAGGETVGLRCPNHELTLKLLEKLKKPLAGPSANPSGEESPKSAQRVFEYFSGKISGIVDGGECTVGTESTLIDMSKTPYKILREGALSEHEIFASLRENLSVIGVTGSTGAGKTSFLKTAENFGALTLDCDKVYHELLQSSEELNRELREQFPEAYTESGLNRKKLGEIVFINAEKMAILNSISHKYVIDETEKRLLDFAINGGEFAVIDAIALIESGLAEKCTASLAITADTEMRISRIISREGIDRKYAEMRVKAQKSDDFYLKNTKYSIENNGDETEFQKSCRDIICRIIGGN